MDLSIITVTHNAKANIAEQIRSVILAARGLDFEQIVVDNNSTDGTPDYIEGEFPDVRIIRNSVNRGFGKANNQGVEVSSGDFILFLNPDNVFLQSGLPSEALAKEGDLKRWFEWMKARPDVGIAGCKLVDAKGQLNLMATPRKFPSVLDMIITLLKLPHIFPNVLNKYLYKDRNFEIEQVVDSVRGSCMLMRREITKKLGFAFDPRYFFWFEDVDTCREAKRLNYKVVYTPIVFCRDLVGQTIKKKNFLWKQKQFLKGACQYFWKWGL
ncbi:MAG: glycosyltransferase family 2 protein [Candidatus Magasanikbacteria bacterium]|nr:glycosyltransferase family 2 protein [Candidatus Magasanikbacteria bacterium]